MKLSFSSLLLAVFTLAGCNLFSPDAPNSAELISGTTSALKIPSLSGSPAVAQVELGTDLNNATLKVDPVPANGVEAQFVTEILISDEGPHVTLNGFRTTESLWVPLSLNASKEYVLPSPDSFRGEPTATAQELAAEALKQHGERWHKLAQQCAGPNKPPCATGVTKIRFRANSGKTFLELQIPGGC